MEWRCSWLTTRLLTLLCCCGALYLIDANRPPTKQISNDAGIQGEIGQRGPTRLLVGGTRQEAIATATLHVPVGRVIVAVQLDEEGVRKLIATLETLMKSISSCLSILLRAFKLVQVRPTTNLDSDEIVTDALGRMIRLPCEYFHMSWSMVCARMDVAFQDCPGKYSAQDSSYTLRCSGETLEEFHEENWTTVPAGERLSMVAFVEGDDYSPTECPTCGFDYEANLSRDSTGHYARE